MSGAVDAGGADEHDPRAAATDAGGLPESARYWQMRYECAGRVWGDGPSELARFAVARLCADSPASAGGSSSPATGASSPAGLTLLDLGCGYGRDTLFLAAELGCRALGVDPSPAAVEAATAATPPGLPVRFEAAEAAAFAAARRAAGLPGFDVVYASNVYHLLRPPDRLAFAAALTSLAAPGARLFLSTLAPGDPQHYGVGDAVTGEDESWDEHVYLHFCSEDELRRDFAAFAPLEIAARDFEEHNADGVVHRHRSWLVTGTRAAG